MEISKQVLSDDRNKTRENEAEHNSMDTTSSTEIYKRKKRKKPRARVRDVNIGNSSDTNSTSKQEASLPVEISAGSSSFLTEGHEGISASGLSTSDQSQASSSTTSAAKKDKRRGRLNFNSSSPKQESPVFAARPTSDPAIITAVYNKSTTDLVHQAAGHGLTAGSVVNEKRKGRYAKKKAAVNESAFQAPSQFPFTPSNAENSVRATPPRVPVKGNSPNTPKYIPAGVQPLTYLRSPLQEKTPKQERFSPYWSDAQVEAGINAGTLIKGCIRINARNYQKAYISLDGDEDDKDILIDGIIDRNRALEGDEVALKLHDASRWQVEEDCEGGSVIRKTGMVVKILEKKHNRCTVGYLKLPAKAGKSNTPKKNTSKEGTPGKNPSTPSSQPQSENCTPKEVAVKLSFTSPSVGISPEMTHSSTITEISERHEETIDSTTLQPMGEQRQDTEPEELLPPELQSGIEHPTPPSGTTEECQIPDTPSLPAEELAEDQSLPSVGNSVPQTTSPQETVELVPDSDPSEVPQKPEAKVEQWNMPEMVLFSPRDARIPRMWVNTKNLPSGTPIDLNPTNCQNHIFLVRITEWNEQPIAKGVLLAYVGEADELDSETAALLLEHNLDVTPFPEDLLKLPPLPFQIPQKELDERRDFRKMCIFTIDPLTAKDLDDALSVRQLDDHHLEIGVHIADPSFFLEEGSELDIFVRKRATSIYLVQQVFHMLPKDLCMLCSLLPGEDKLAFSLIMVVDMRTWTVTSHEFSRSVICSCAQLAYEHAQAFIDNPDRDWSDEDFPTVHNGYTINDLCRAVNSIRPYTAILRERREDFCGGALSIYQPKLCFMLDDVTCMPKDVFVYESKESHRMIEELMLMANILTAQRLHSIYPKHAFLRRHGRPKMRMLKSLAQELMHYGIHISTTSAGALNASLRHYGMGYLERDSRIVKDSIEGCHDTEVDSTICPLGGSGENENVPEEFEALAVHQIACSNVNIEEGGLTSTIEEIDKDVDLEACPVPNTSKEDSHTSPLKSEMDGLDEKVGSLSLKPTIDDEKADNQPVREYNLRPRDSTRVKKEPSVQETGNEVGHRGNAQPVHKVGKAVRTKRNNFNSLSKNFVPSPLSMPPNEEELTRARDLVLNHLCAKPMVRADYYCLGAGIEKTENKNLKWKLENREEEESDEVYTQHYALNVPLYTHFTSPIRRYADIMVHRLLAASLGYSPPPSSDPMEIQKIATNCNSQNYGAKRASEASNELFFRLWIRLQVEKGKKNGLPLINSIQGSQNAGDLDESRSEGGLREAAVVVNAKDYSFDAILLRFGILVRVYVNKLPASVQSYKKHGTNTISILWYLPGRKAVTRASPRQDIAMFSVVDVMIYYSYTTRRIRAELVNPVDAR
ncbi:DIS3-like exonuclease 2 [Hetaerina americana]|uniref:DIS3-like exonuclease 2 n=1 Tax=Hetaerina americana TaxID=62018 RepID=UPI003A7F1820